MSRVYVLSLMLPLIACGSLHAQATSVAPANTQGLTESSGDQHKSAVELIDLMGARQRLIANSDKMFEAGADAMRKQDAKLSSEFTDEWLKRMQAGFNPDDYLRVMVKVYETHFNTAELVQLIQAQKVLNASGQPVLSDALRSKLSSEGTTIQSEIMGGCAQVGAKLGGDVGLQIQKEHPEWVKASSTPAAQ